MDKGVNRSQKPWPALLFLSSQAGGAFAQIQSQPELETVSHMGYGATAPGKEFFQNSLLWLFGFGPQAVAPEQGPEGQSICAACLSIWTVLFPLLTVQQKNSAL